MTFFEPELPNVSFENKGRKFIDGWQDLLVTIQETPPIIPILPPAAFMCAIANAGDGVIWQDEMFKHWVEGTSIDSKMLDLALFAPKPLASHCLDKSGAAIILIYCRLVATENWPIRIPIEFRTRPNSSKVAIIAISFCHLSDSFIDAAKAFDMTSLEAKTTAALVRFGNLRLAADSLGITYNTARSTIKDALKKTNCRKQAQLIAKISQITSPANITHVSATNMLVDVFSLSPREAKLALLLTEGRTRSEAAKLIGISDAVAKDAFENIFATLNVSSANEIGRILFEALAASLLTECPSAELPNLCSKQEPLRFISRGNGEFIAISDYGTKNGKPIIFIHGSGTTRQIPRSLVRALQAQKYRPIAIDRPGFGLTDLCGFDCDAFEAGAHDMAIVCDKLGFDEIDIFARGGAQVALRFAHFYPKLLGKIAVINPSNQCGDSAKMPGILGQIMRKLFLNPDRIETLAKWLGAHCSPGTLKYLLKASMRASPPDLKVFEDPDELEDYLRSSMMFITGRVEGFVNEHRLYGKPLNPAPLKDAQNWIVFNGSFDPLQNPASTKPFWSPLLPNAKFVTYEDGGHFIHLSHTSEILQEFAKITPQMGVHQA